MKLFALFNGCYSDERLVGIYSTQEYAERAARIFHDDAHIEECDLDPKVNEMAMGMTLYFVRIARESGNVLDCHVEGSSYGAFTDAMREDINKDFYTYCWANSSAHAIKIAGDRRRMVLSGAQS